MALPQLSVCIPGLYSHLTAWEKDFAFRLPSGVLQQFLSSSYQRPLSFIGIEQTLLYLTGFSMATPPSWACLRYQKDFSQQAEYPVLCADPVSLHSSHDGIYLQPEFPVLSPPEARQLCTVLNKHLALDGWCLQWKHPQRWYLMPLDSNPAYRNWATWPQTTAPSVLAKQNIFTYLPVVQGKRSSYWEQLLTELQMLLHQQPLNTQREQARQAMVNSLWFWGEGEIPVLPAQILVDQIISDKDSVIAESLASFLGCHYQCCKGMGDLTEHRHTLLILDNLRLSALNEDPQQWQEQLVQLEQNWLYPLWLKWKQKRCQVMIYDAAGHSWQLKQRFRWRFW